MRGAAFALALVLCVVAPVRAATVMVPVRVGVTVTVPCRITAPTTVAVDDSGRAVVRNAHVVDNCDRDPHVAVEPEASKRGGYVVTIIF